MDILDRDKITTFLKEDIRRAFNSPTIIIMCLITGSVVFAITNSVHGVLLAAKDDRIKAIETKHEGIEKEYVLRLEKRQDVVEYMTSLVSEYRERLGLIPPDGNPYSKLTHTELKEKVLELVNQIWPFIVGYREKEHKILNDWMLVSMRFTNLSPEEQKKEWENFRRNQENLSNEYHNKFRRNYSKDYTTDLLLLREEVLSRIPQEKIKTLKVASWSKANWMLSNSSKWSEDLLRELVMLAKRLDSEETD